MSGRKIKVACVQLRSSDDIDWNIRQASALIRLAHKDGARFIATPENTTLMAPDGGAKLEKSFAEKDDPTLPSFCALAAELGVWLLIGSLAIKGSPDKTANRSVLIAPDGRIEARYDKIHLFDVNLPSGETYRESACFVVAPAQGGEHANGRRTYGHSLIVGPWGDILAEGGTDPQLVAAELDLDDIAAARGRVPALHHDRPFTPPGA